MTLRWQAKIITVLPQKSQQKYNKWPYLEKSLGDKEIDLESLAEQSVLKVILSLGFFMVDVAKGTPGLIGLPPKRLGF